MQAPPGQRILVWGNSCAGKSTLASQLSAKFDLRFVELDALNWLPNWVGLNMTEPDRLIKRMQLATKGDRWVVAGSYTAQSKAAFWPRLDMVIWLDLPKPLLIWRCLKRSFTRWRDATLLWGTNRESFWQQLKVWEGEESLLWWVYTQHDRKRRQTLEFIADGTWKDAQVVRVKSPRELSQLLNSWQVTDDHTLYQPAATTWDQD